MQLPTRTRFCQKLYLAWLKCGWGWRGEGENSEKSPRWTRLTTQKLLPWCVTHITTAPTALESH